MIDDEAHDARNAIRHGIGDQRDAADHISPDDVVVCAAWSGRSLRVEDFVVIAKIGLGPGSRAGCDTCLFLSIALGLRVGKERTEWTWPLAGLDRPIETVLHIRRAAN